MNILHLAYRDTSGVPGRWVRAHRAAGHQARLVVELPHPFVYGNPTRTRRWSTLVESTDLIADDLEWADVLMVYDHPIYLEAALTTRKPILWRALGASARKYARELVYLLRAPQVVRASAGLPDIASLLNVDLTGAPYPLLDRADPAALVLLHAPADRRLKGTETVLRAAQNTPWCVDLVEGESNRVVMRRKRRAALVVDSFSEFGYGVNAIEAMAMGLPAVAGGAPLVRDRWRREGSPVVLVDGEEDLHRSLVRLADDGELRARLGERGRGWVGSFHDPATRAEEDVSALERLAVAA